MNKSKKVKKAVLEEEIDSSDVEEDSNEALGTSDDESGDGSGIEDGSQDLNIDEGSSSGSEKDDEIDIDDDENDVDAINDDESDIDTESDDESDIGTENNDENDINTENDDDWLNALDHKKALSNLKNTDPEFYKYLADNDKKLLQFNASDESEEEDDDEKLHKPPEELEVDSDESDFEAETPKDGLAVTLAIVKECRQDLAQPTAQSINKAVELFRAALDKVTGENKSEYKIDGSSVFNAVIEMCVLQLQPALVNFLKLTPSSLKQPEKSKKWVKVKSAVQSYFTDLFKLLNGVASEHIVSVMLKHLHSTCSFVACFQKLSRTALKQLTRLWSTGEETVRVLAFLCILRLTSTQKNLLNTALKLMYIAYIRSSKFVSMNTLPNINFMKQSLVDLFAQDPQLSYQHAFLYIRQLAIHLRNAITIHKKESFQTVYNWQYIHSLRLWVDLISSTKTNGDDPHEILQQLLYPIVQSLAKVDLNKRLKKASMKPYDFTFVLRLSKAAMTETGYTDAVIENVFNLLLEYGATYSNSIAFPDLVIPAITQIKPFLKNCKIPKYSSKLKQVLVKFEDNVKFVSNERNKLHINLKDNDQIKHFETNLSMKGPPLEKYWKQVSEVHVMKKAKQATDNTKIANQGMPLMKLNRTLKRKPVDDGPVELFPSDESDFEFPDVEVKKSETKIKKKRRRDIKIKEKKITAESEEEVSDKEDIVKPLNIKDF